jgi:hypothetical protein
MATVTHWWYNTESGQLTRSNVLTQALQSIGSVFGLSAGWHELDIPGSASAAQATAEAEKEFPGATPPTTAGINPERIASGAASDAGAGALNLFKLTFGNTTGLLGRIIKVVLGGVLLISGIIRLTGADKDAIGVAGKAAVFA